MIYLSSDKVFYTIEGEGRYAGMPSVFMRLAMCNLTCKGWATPDSPDGCDSAKAWRVKLLHTLAETINLLEEYQARFLQGAILKLTGGEPLIQQKALERICIALDKRWGYLPQIDFETNGTLVPNDYWFEKNVTWTVSPKLANNGDPKAKRFVPKALEALALLGPRCSWKFVVKHEKDLEEIQENYVERFNITSDDVWLMPCCGSRKELVEVSPQVAEWAKTRCWKFSPRLQLVVWNKALGV